MPVDRTLYEILHVSPNASASEIKKSYYRLAKEFHPDKNADHGDKFKEISFAYDVLSNEEKKRIYDSRGLDGLKEGAASGSFAGFEDVFGRFFGGSGGFSPFDLFTGGHLGGFGRANARRKTKSYRQVLMASLDEFYQGATKRVEIAKKVVCRACDGVGGQSASSVRSCGLCKGSGMQIKMIQLGPGMIQQSQGICPDCNGAGETIKESDRCKKCKGAKVVETKKTLEVHITPGMRDEERITFHGESDEYPGMETGDIVIVVKQEPHERFERRGNDLVMAQKITVGESLCGFTLLVQHFGNRVLAVRHPPGDPIKPNSYRAVLGEGMPNLRHHVHGNLIIIFEIIFPKSSEISIKKLEAIEKLLPPKPKVVVPDSDEVEEVHLMEVDNTRGRRGGRREAYEEGSDDEEHHGAGVHTCQAS